MLYNFMAREAILRDTKPLVSRRYTWITGNSCPKGTYLFCGADQTASTAVTTGAAFVGFAHADVNTSTDTSFNTETSVTADKGGMYELTASLAIQRNAYVKTAAGSNYIMQATEADLYNCSSAIIIGIAREAASAGEQINVEVFP